MCDLIAPWLAVRAIGTTVLCNTRASNIDMHMADTAVIGLYRVFSAPNSGGRKAESANVMYTNEDKHNFTMCAQYVDPLSDNKIASQSIFIS